MNDQPSNRWTLPNLLTGFRFVAAPILLWQAWHGFDFGFMLLLALAFLTDLLDGFVARMTDQVSEFGAALDSWADVVNYLTIALGCWWLWPEVVRQEKLFVFMVLASCLLPAGAGLVKFGQFTSYHTWGVKLAAACMGLTLYLLFLGGPAWPFRVAAVICMLAALEEMVLTLILSMPESNVGSIWKVWHRRKSSRE